MTTCRHRTLPSGQQITEWDLLSWETQFRREGTLPPEVQALLFQFAASNIREHGVNTLTFEERIYP